MLRMEQIEIAYGDKIVIHDFNLELKKGEKVVLVGPSGCGKSSLLRVAAALQIPSAGRVYLAGELLTPKLSRKLRCEISYLPQQLTMNSVVLDFIKIPFQFAINSKESDLNGKIEELLFKLGLDRNILTQNFQDISGGQKQRVLLLITMLLNRPIMALDEVISALDGESKSQVLELIFNKKQLTLVSSSHDPAWIERCDRIINV